MLSFKKVSLPLSQESHSICLSVQLRKRFKISAHLLSLKLNLNQHEEEKRERTLLMMKGGEWLIYQLVSSLTCSGYPLPRKACHKEWFHGAHQSTPPSCLLSEGEPKRDTGLSDVRFLSPHLDGQGGSTSFDISKIQKFKSQTRRLISFGSIGTLPPLSLSLSLSSLVTRTMQPHRRSSPTNSLISKLFSISKQRKSIR
jgi:hypothetical protein